MSNKKDKKEDIIEEELSEDNENDGSINEAEIPEVEIEVITEANGSETININDKNTVIAEGAFSQLIPKIEILPDQLGIIAVQHRPLFPHMVIPLVVEGELYQKTLKIAQKSEPGYIGIVLSKDSFDLEKPVIKDLHEYGVVARIAKVFSQDEKSSQVLLDVLERIKITKPVKTKSKIMLAKVEYLKPKKLKINDEIRAYSREILTNMKELIQLNPLIKEELNQFVNQISLDDPSRLADFAATLTTAKRDELQSILSTTSILKRLGKTLLLIKKELELSKLQADISKRIEERISEHQREFFLKEQLKEIRKELGLSKDEKTQEFEKLEKKAKKLNFPKEAEERFREEMDKLSLLDIQSPEFNVSRSYLDWITSLPWGIFSNDNLNIKKARGILDADHYGLDDVKEIILEFIATLKLKKKIAGTILCFVGPPGVGKTSVGKSIARALSRKFYRFSVGGMRDEAEIKGHRRTYIGALPGKFIQALKLTKSANPVIMLDEIDKIGNSFHGDPASALLEALDPDQNATFVDHYLDVPFDLSKVLFIATANQLDTIPPALLDRMEIIRLSGYITKEKQKIARRYLIPKQRKEHGLTAKQFNITDPAVKKIINGYAREAGVRNLENLIKKICRKVAMEIVEKNIDQKFNIGIENIIKYLKSPIFEKDELLGEGKVGITTGLAWTSMGGAVLSIEASRIISHQKGMKQTGQLGDVMVESSEIAYSYVVANAEKFGGDPEFFKKYFIHMHVPAGATPKDGPSAGVTMATVLISSLLDKPVIPKLGMTGELTLIGEVLPIGGLKEKIIAARRSGLKQIIVPEQNRKDYLELPDHLKDKIEVFFAKTYDDVFKIAFPK
ncbi:MAG: endopeptidase La [Deltaproteobacteria bacterium]|jgi:ATP-dependent Lon protease|nr:endopeptidase La [Deltaproteobacteria bacterium]